MISFLFATLLHLFGFALLVVSIYYGSFGLDHYEIAAKIFHLPSAIIIFFGLLGILLATTHFKDIFELFKITLINSPAKIRVANEYADEKFEEITNAYYKEGPQGVSKLIDVKKLPSIWVSIFEQLDAKVAPADIKVLLQRKYLSLKENYLYKIKLLEFMIASGPSLGMFGTVLGLIKLLKDLSDFSQIGPNMALALITTLYGIFVSLLLSPVSRHLENKLRKIARSFDQATFWLDVVKDKKPGFFMTEDFQNK